MDSKPSETKGSVCTSKVPSLLYTNCTTGLSKHSSPKSTDVSSHRTVSELTPTTPRDNSYNVHSQLLPTGLERSWHARHVSQTTWDVGGSIQRREVYSCYFRRKQGDSSNTDTAELEQALTLQKHLASLSLPTNIFRNARATHIDSKRSKKSGN